MDELIFRLFDRLLDIGRLFTAIREDVLADE